MIDEKPDLQEVWDYYGKRILSGYGEWVKAECPLLSHEDHNPSASVNLDAGKWRCFSCDGRGDAFDIIMANEGDDLAGLADARAWAKEHFASRGGDVRQQRRPSSGISVRPPARKGARNWQPPWSGR